MGVFLPDVDIPRCCGECRCSGTDVCREWMAMDRRDLGTKRAETCPAIPASDDLVSLKEVYWALNSYFIPRMNINHVVSQDISIALSGLRVVGSVRGEKQGG